MAAKPRSVTYRLQLTLYCFSWPLANKTTPSDVRTSAASCDALSRPSLVVVGERSAYRVDHSASPKLTEPLLDTPRSVTAITREAREDAAVTSVKEAFRLQPGITLGTGEGGNAFGDRIFVRGYDARNDVYIDGLRDPGVVSRETFAVERIEVLHGPSSTLGGRGTTGGAVRIVTKMPTAENFVSPDVSIGTGQTVRATLDANAAPGERVHVRLNALRHRADEIPGRDAIADDRHGAAIAVAFSPTENTALTADYYRLDTDGIPDWGHPYDAEGNRPYPVDRDNFYGVVDRDFHETSASTATLHLEHEFSDALRLDAQFRHGVTTNSYIVSAPGFSSRSCPGLDPSRQVCASAKTREEENDFTGGQVNLIGAFGPDAVRHTVVVGLESSEEAVDVRRPSVRPRGVALDLVAPNPELSWSGEILPPTSAQLTEVDTSAVYVLDTVRVGERWRFSAGLRRDAYEIAAASGPTDYSTRSEIAAVDRHFTNWNAGVVYKPVPAASLYAAVSTSSNPPGEQVDVGTAASYGGLSPGFQSYAPERNTNYEASVKWDLLDERLAFAAAAFTTRKKGQLNAAGRGASARYGNDGASEVRGISVSLAGQASDRLSLLGGATWLDTEVTAQPLNSAAVGELLANVPERSASVQARYQLTPSLAFGGTLYYQSEVYGGTLEARDTRIPGYARVDAMAEYRASDKVSLRLNVLNATDRTYYDTLYRSSVPFVYVAPGRQVQLTMSMSFSD